MTGELFDVSEKHPAPTAIRRFVFRHGNLALVHLENPSVADPDGAESENLNVF